MDIIEIQAAKDRIADYVKRTSLERSETLSRELGANVFVKYELFQKTGSFKSRGAFNKMLGLSDEEKKRGVVAVSGGNHAQAVAYAASVLSIDAVICMPANTPKNYLDATSNYGAKLDLHPTIADAFTAAEALRDAGRVYVHPFDDELVIAGQGTVGLEITEDLPDISHLFVSIGGGGLSSGVAIAVKEKNQNAKVWGVETEGANAMAKAIEAGHPVEIAITSIAKTLGAPAVTERTLKLTQELLEDVIVVSDREAVDALVFIEERLKVTPEPASSCTLAAARRLKDKFSPDDNVVLILCGGNLSVRDLCGYL